MTADDADDGIDARGLVRDICLYYTHILITLCRGKTITFLVSYFLKSHVCSILLKLEYTFKGVI